jgi:hypothetical protein
MFRCPFGPLSRRVSERARAGKCLAARRLHARSQKDRCMIFQRFSLAATAAMLLVGVVAGMIPALQGLLLPELAREGRLTLPQLGQVAMAEAIGTLLAIAVANAKLRTQRLRLFTICVAAIGAALDLGTPHLSGVGIIGARFLHGLCSGSLLWMWTSFLTRTANPGRLVAFDVAVQASLIAALASWFSVSIIPDYGVAGAFTIFAAIYGGIGLLALLIPNEFASLPGHGGTVRPTVTGLVGLVVVFALISAIVGTWVYLKPYGEKIGLSPEQTNVAISVALGCKVGASLLMTVIAGWLRPTRTLLCLSGASIATILFLLTAGSSTMFIAGVAAFAFLWMCTTPMLMPFLIEIDPTRRSAIHIGTAQLLGAATGPGLASVAVSSGDASTALILTASLYGLGGLVMIVTMWRQSEAATPESPAAPISQPSTGRSA